MLLSSIGRAAIKRIGGSQISTNRFLATIWQFQRVEGQQNADFTLTSPSASILARRLYATATRSAAKKPATKRESAKKSAAAKKPTAKKPVKKAAAKSVKKSVKKPVKKLVKKPGKKPFKKPVKKIKAKKVKAKAKPKPKKKKVVVLTDSQKLRKQIKELRVTALIKDFPKQKAQNAFKVLFEEIATGQKDIIGSSKLASSQWKSASTELVERLNRISNENKAANLSVYKKWVESHTPEEIRLANLARLHLRRLTKSNTSPPIIKDDRAPKGRCQPLTFFVKERFQSGDFAGIKVTEALKRIATEFSQLSPEQRKRYEDASAADTKRYNQEYKAAYKHDPQSVVKARASS